MRGDEERLFITHSNRLRRVVAANVRTSAANIDDACAFAWLQLVDRQPRRQAVFAWLATVAIRDALRRDGRERRVVSVDDLAEVSVEARPADVEVEERIVLCEVLEQLTGIHPRKRQMLVMHATGFSCEEIAAEHGIATARARELIYQARLQLRQRMGLAGIEPRSRK